MDQTTETADLTETEKYLKNCSTITTMFSTNSSDIDDDDDEEDPPALDALLGGIRCGLDTMTKTARNSLSTCKNKIELDDAIAKIQASSLNLLKMEKSFLNNATIVSEVVEDLISDFEDEDEQTLDENDDGESKKEDERKGAGDADATMFGKGISKQKPYIFRPTARNVVSIERFREKLKTEYHKRMGEYKDSLTDDMLKEDKKFEALLQQIKLGKNDAETAIDKKVKQMEEKVANLGQVKTEPSPSPPPRPHNDDVTDNATFLSSLPYSADELKNHRYKPYNEDEELDDSVLPTVDPISKTLIAFPVKNKYCNHVFDRASIYTYIAGNPEDAKCPVHMCRNERKLERSHFLTDNVLTTHIRRKNNF